MRNKVVAPLLIVLGLFMLFGGFNMLNSDSVTCGGKDMRSGDTCREVHRRSGHTTRRSFDQQRRNNHSSGLMLLGFGAVAVVGGTVWTIATYRRRPAAPPNYYAAPGATPYYPPPGPQGYYPPSDGSGYAPPPSGQPYYPPPNCPPPVGPPPPQ